MPNYITIPQSQTPVTYSEDQLIEMVKLRMDEVDSSSGMRINVGVVNNKPITGMVDGLLNESRLDVLKNAASMLVPKGKLSVSSSDLSLADGHAILSVPDDFIRLISVKCTSWRRTVTAFHDTLSKEYSRQQYEYARSTNKNPVVIVFDGNTYGLFPFAENDSAEVIYVSSSTGYDSFSEQMISAICWACASKIFSILGMPDNAVKASEIYASIIK